jgi:hypothetical protein
MKKKLFGSVFVAALAMFSLAATTVPANAATSAAVWDTVGGVTAVLPCFPCVETLGAADVFGAIDYVGTVAGGPVATVPQGSIAVGGVGTNLSYSEPTCAVGIATGTLGSALGVLTFAYLRLGGTAGVVGITGTTAVTGVVAFVPVNTVDTVLRCAGVPQAILGIPTGASATDTPFTVKFSGAGVIAGV